MEASVVAGGVSGRDLPRPLEIVAPDPQELPVVLASPHSGRDYPATFLAQSRLDARALRKSEDSYVDEILAPAAKGGVPLLKALFPRAYVDPNREMYELDPDMFDDPLPAYVNTRSPRVAAGLGTIAKVVAQGENIYRDKLSFDEAIRRVRGCYAPYHEALGRLIRRTLDRFGTCLLIDGHSMPSAITMDGRAPKRAGGPGASIDFVVGDCYGTACAPAITDLAVEWLAARGYRVVRNTPYAGGFTTRHYGRPEEGVHALQIEVNRALYMDEATLERRPYLDVLADELAELVGLLGRVDLAAAAA